MISTYNKPYHTTNKITENVIKCVHTWIHSKRYFIKYPDTKMVVYSNKVKDYINLWQQLYTMDFIITHVSTILNSWQQTLSGFVYALLQSFHPSKPSHMFSYIPFLFTSSLQISLDLNIMRNFVIVMFCLNIMSQFVT